MKTLRNPSTILLVAAVLLIIASVANWNYTTGINFQDAYYIIPGRLMLWGWVLVLLIFRVIYLFTNLEERSPFLTQLHVTSTCLMVISEYLATFHSFLPRPQELYFTEPDWRTSLTLYVQTLVLAMFFVGQGAFIINILGSRSKPARETIS